MTITRRKALKMLAITGASMTLAPTIAFAGDKTVICCWNKFFPPFSMEKNGKMTGILVDCVNEMLGKRMGFNVVHRGYKWAEAQDLVRTGKADSLCTNPTHARKQFMFFCAEPMVESAPSIFCTMNNQRRSEIDAIRTVDDLKKFRQVDYVGNGWARKTFPPSLRITYADTLTDAFAMIADGKADIFVGNSLAAMYTIKQSGLKGKIHARELPVGEPSSFHFGLRRDFPGAKGIVEEFEATLDEAMLDNATRKIIMEYL